jgi:hypothetical protein
MENNVDRYFDLITVSEFHTLILNILKKKNCVGQLLEFYIITLNYLSLNGVFNPN